MGRRVSTDEDKSGPNRIKRLTASASAILLFLLFVWTHDSWADKDWPFNKTRHVTSDAVHLEVSTRDSRSIVFKRRRSGYEQVLFSKESFSFNRARVVYLCRDFDGFSVELTSASNPSVTQNNDSGKYIMFCNPLRRDHLRAPQTEGFDEWLFSSTSEEWSGNLESLFGGPLDGAEDVIQDWILKNLDNSIVLPEFPRPDKDPQVVAEERKREEERRIAVEECERSYCDGYCTLDGTCIWEDDETWLDPETGILYPD